MSQLKIKDDNDQWINIPASGIGIPSGGTEGQVLQKSSNTDYATQWVTVDSGLHDSDIIFIDTAIDLNNLTSTGFYCITTDGSNVQHQPNGIGGFYMIVLARPDGYTLQVIFTSSAFFVRAYIVGAWRSWFKTTTTEVA